MHFVDGGALGVQMARGDVSFVGPRHRHQVRGHAPLRLRPPDDGSRRHGACPPRSAACSGSSRAISTASRSARPRARSARSSRIARARSSSTRRSAPRRSRSASRSEGVDGRAEEDVERRGRRGALHERLARRRGRLGSVDRGDRQRAARRHVDDEVEALDPRPRPIELDDFGVAIGGMPDAGEWLSRAIVRAVGEVLNNPWEQRPHRRRIESDARASTTRATSGGCAASRSSIRSSTRARRRASSSTSCRSRVPRSRRASRSRIPAELAGQDVDIEIVPGYEVVPDLAAPENLDRAPRERDAADACCRRASSCRSAAHAGRRVQGPRRAAPAELRARRAAPDDERRRARGHRQLGPRRRAARSLRRRPRQGEGQGPREAALMSPCPMGIGYDATYTHRSGGRRRASAVALLASRARSARARSSSTRSTSSPAATSRASRSAPTASCARASRSATCRVSGATHRLLGARARRRDRPRRHEPGRQGLKVAGDQVTVLADTGARA